jgi:hypothetical protein
MMQALRLPLGSLRSLGVAQGCSVLRQTQDRILCAAKWRRKIRLSANREGSGGAVGACPPPKFTVAGGNLAIVGGVT